MILNPSLRKLFHFTQYLQRINKMYLLETKLHKKNIKVFTRRESANKY